MPCRSARSRRSRPAPQNLVHPQTRSVKRGARQRLSAPVRGPGAITVRAAARPLGAALGAPSGGPVANRTGTAPDAARTRSSSARSCSRSPGLAQASATAPGADVARAGAARGRARLPVLAALGLRRPRARPRPIAQSTGLALLAVAAAGAIAARARAASPRRPRQHRARHASAAGLPLSPREREVAALIVQGKANRDDAAAGFVSEQTIEYHLSNVYEKRVERTRRTRRLHRWQPESARSRLGDDVGHRCRGPGVRRRHRRRCRRARSCSRAAPSRFHSGASLASHNPAKPCGLLKDPADSQRSLIRAQASATSSGDAVKLDELRSSPAASPKLSPHRAKAVVATR